MNDLIWIGNTLLPRWFVFGGVGLVVLERQDLIDSCFGPNGRPYIGVWTHFGKNRNIYSDDVVAFRKFEAPPHVSDAVLVGAT